MDRFVGSFACARQCKHISDFEKISNMFERPIDGKDVFYEPTTGFGST